MSKNYSALMTRSTLIKAICIFNMFILFTTSVGCDNGPSFVSEVTGTVTIDGKPFPKVKVTFVPQINIEGNFMPTAVTDETGNFSLSMLGGEAGCPAVECKVIVTEPSPPSEIQENMMAENPDDRMLKKYLRSLKHRPIPENYTLLKFTPFVFEVSDDNHVFDLELER